MQQAVLILESERMAFFLKRFKIGRLLMPTFYTKDLVEQDIHDRGATSTSSDFNFEKLPVRIHWIRL